MIGMMSHRPRAVIVATTLTAMGLLGVGGLTGCTATGSEGGHTAGSVADVSAQHSTSSVSKKIALYSAMSDLWAQHMEWTYITVTAFAQGSSSLTPSLDRLLQNQADLGNAIKPFYGAEAGDQLTVLLKAHINDAVPVLTAAKAGDTTALNKAVTAWYANAKEIGDFLAAANPHWNKAEMEQMMKTHITQTIAYATDALGGDYTKAVTDYGLAEQHMEQMAGMLSAGIIQQFPNKFK
ncbi:hypothetical protein GCM10028798_32520 [Humibacter antri]